MDAQFNQQLKKTVFPIFDHYLIDMINQRINLQGRKPNKGEVDSLISSIKCIIRPVIGNGDEMYGSAFIGDNDGQMVENLNPYVLQFLPYGPCFAEVLIGYESVSRFGCTARPLTHLGYVVARLIYNSAPESYKTIEALFDELDNTTIVYIHRLEGYSSPETVLQRQRINVIGTLYRMALSPHEGWPNKNQDVCRWAKEYLKRICDWASFDMFLQSDIKTFLWEIDHARQY